MKKFIFTVVCVLIIVGFYLPAYCFNSAATGVSQVSLLKSYKDISKNFIVINKMKKRSQTLSIKDKCVITKYFHGAVKGENTFLLMNCFLRGNLNQYLNKKDNLPKYADCLSIYPFHAVCLQHLTYLALQPLQRIVRRLLIAPEHLRDLRVAHTRQVQIQHLLLKAAQLYR